MTWAKDSLKDLEGLYFSPMGNKMETKDKGTVYRVE